MTQHLAAPCLVSWGGLGLFSQRNSQRLSWAGRSTGTSSFGEIILNRRWTLSREIGFTLCAFLASFVAGCSSVKTVPVRQSESRQYLLLPVEVNGTPTTFLLDTGTTHTVISKEFTDRIGIRGDSPEREVPIEIGGPGANQVGHVTRLKSFRIGSIEANRKSGQKLIVDMSRLFAQIDDGVSGLLGNAMWSSADYVLDAGSPSLLISRRLGLSKTPDSLRLNATSGKTYLPIEIEGRTFDFLLDTGASTSRVTQEVIDKLRPVNNDYVELEITTMGSTEYKKLPALHAEVQLGQVHIPQFTFLVGKENVIGLNLLRYGELSMSAREGMFIFRGHESP